MKKIKQKIKKFSKQTCFFTKYKINDTIQMLDESIASRSGNDNEYSP